jgi:hypothetical protein
MGVDTDPHKNVVEKTQEVFALKESEGLGGTLFVQEGFDVVIGGLIFIPGD